jgi:signal transduction histidine kinase
MRVLSSLTNRIFLASALLAVLSIGTALYIVNVRVTREAEGQLQRGLHEAGRLVEQHRATLFDNFIRMARLAADQPRLKAAVDLAHPPTVQPLAEEYRTQLDSALVVITHRSGRILAEAGASGTKVAVSPPAIERALTGHETAAFWPTSRGLLQVVTVPMVLGPDPPEVLGALTVGFGLDDRLAARLKAVTESEIAFAADGRIQAATLPPADVPALGALVGWTGSTRLWLGDEEYVALSQRLSPMGSAAGVETAAGATPTVIVLRSRTEQLQFLRSLHAALAVTAVLAVALATLVSYGVARTVTRPLRALTATMGEMAATGDLGRGAAIPEPGRWQDEDARLLARAFKTMTGAIGRFQREAAQRERLSSLGRLSTVVAHEVRNPLMIIKAAVRTLRLESVGPAERREALVDIDGEIARLNRLVEDVLDFARPVRYEYGRADINQVCRAAVTAATAGDGTVRARPRLDLDPGLPELVTDAERLHIALVNVLTNARHALVPGDGDGAEPIVVATRRPDEHRVSISVRDRGRGIAAEDLPRIFEPYFTTRRGGSGLGLAIAKNIVEGLGGSITIDSRVGEGTEVRIELPDAPGAAAEGGPSRELERSLP